MTVNIFFQNTGPNVRAALFDNNNISKYKNNNREY